MHAGEPGVSDGFELRSITRSALRWTYGKERATRHRAHNSPVVDENGPKRDPAVSERRLPRFHPLYGESRGDSVPWSDGKCRASTGH